MTGQAPEDDPLWRQMVENGSLERYKVRYFARLGSTSTVARQMAAQGEEAGTIVVADGQDGGRGRLGRRFFSPAGYGLYFSQLHEPRLPGAEVPRMTLAAGLAAARAIESLWGCGIGIKWPNDLLVNNRKIGGILAESIFVPDQNRLMVILGIGINLTTPPHVFELGHLDPAARASSLLLETGRSAGRGELLLAIVRQLDILFTRLYSGGFGAILDAWRRRDVTIGRTLQWVTPQGGIIEGVSLGPDDDGQLAVQDRHGQLHHVLSGDITLATDPVP